MYVPWACYNKQDKWLSFVLWPQLNLQLHQQIQAVLFKDPSTDFGERIFSQQNIFLPKYWIEPRFYIDSSLIIYALYLETGSILTNIWANYRPWKGPFLLYYLLVYPCYWFFLPSVCLSIHPAVCASVHPSICPSGHPSIHWSINHQGMNMMKVQIRERLGLWYSFC